MEAPARTIKAKVRSESAILTKDYFLDWLLGYTTRDRTGNIVNFVVHYLADDYFEAGLNLLQQEDPGTLLDLITYDLHSNLRRFYNNELDQASKKTLALMVLRLEDCDQRVEGFLTDRENEDLSYDNIFLEYINGLSRTELRQIVVLFLLVDGKFGPYPRQEVYAGYVESRGQIDLIPPLVSDSRLLKAMQGDPPKT